MSTTPMLRQYYGIKSEYPDCILFFRLGDFYEMFAEDAKLAAQLLEITLTGRDAGNEERIPMCGVPYHAADSYISKLVGLGYKVAVCEQVEDPKEAKGVVRREVIRVVTPGTVVDGNLLHADANNYLSSVILDDFTVGLASVDVSTGEFVVSEFAGPERLQNLTRELSRLEPAECIIPPSQREALESIFTGLHTSLTVHNERAFHKDTAYRRLVGHFQTASLAGFGCEQMRTAIRAAGAILNYLDETQKRSISHITSLRVHDPAGFMVIDEATRRNLELISTMRGSSRKGTLLGVLDYTKTAMGARMIRHWIEQPLLDAGLINERQEAVATFCGDLKLRDAVVESLAKVYDLERLVGRIGYGTATPRDITALRTSVAQLPALKSLLASTKGLLQQSFLDLDPLEDICSLIEKTLVEDPPISPREGNLVAPGFNSEVDRLRTARREGTNWIAQLEETERRQTGIKSLKVGFNKVFGYYLEVTKANLHLVPDYYIRKQTLANAERYVTPELKEKEALILEAEEKLNNLEYEIFCDLRSKIAEQAARIQKSASIVAALDALASLSTAATVNRYCRPKVDESGVIDIKGGRHPVVANSLGDGLFVPNDHYLDRDSTQIVILTGPNMAGKSTYLRQLALIVLMAQIGSFVPAQSASIGIVDRIFTRVGASDDLATGQSTFMVEMTETANIVHNATPRSLIVIDELGRGTSTYDGMALTQAVTEYIHDRIGAKTVISTHFHELTRLAGELERVANFRTEVREANSQVTFLYRVVKGGADKSYGINVARMAGLPASIIVRAESLLTRLEGTSSVNMHQIGLWDLMTAEAAAVSLSPDEAEVLERIREMDVNTMTPIEALNCLYQLREKLIKT